MNYKVEIIRSNRRSLGLEITRPDVLTVRAPYHLSQKEIDRFLEEKELWIYENLEKVARIQKDRENAVVLSQKDIQALAQKAKNELPELVNKWATTMGVSYGRITIRNQKTRWGSCSAKGNLNFNCLLMLVPKEVREYVIIHELAHRIEMNHSKAFWEVVASYDSDYKEHRRWLKDEGAKIIT